MLNPQPGNSGGNTNPGGGSNNNPPGGGSGGGPSGGPSGGGPSGGGPSGEPSRGESSQSTNVNRDPPIQTRPGKYRKCNQPDCPVDHQMSQYKLYSDSKANAIKLNTCSQKSPGFYVGYDHNTREFILIPKKGNQRYDNPSNQSEIFNELRRLKNLYYRSFNEGESYNDSVQTDCRNSILIGNLVRENRKKATDS